MRGSFKRPGMVRTIRRHSNARIARTKAASIAIPIMTTQRSGAMGAELVTSRIAIAASEADPAEPTPWQFELEDDIARIRDAAGNVIMCNVRYYPWCPNAMKSWQLIVKAVNTYTQRTKP